MPVPLLSKAPTCLSCLRQTWTGRSRTAAAVLVGLTQVRGKKRSGRPRDQGVVVRLLRDVSTYGRRGTIFRIERGRMRNILYPEGKAEYMTRGRFAELGLSVADTLGERDFQFGAGLPGAADAQEEEAESRAEQQRQATAEVPSLSPERAALLLQSMLPAVLRFERKPIPAQGRSRSPLFADAVASQGAPVAVFGSVSAEDIAASIRQLLGKDPEASLIRVEGRDVRFIEDGVERIKTLGRSEIEIVVRTEAPSAVSLESVKRAVEVVAEGAE